MVHAGAEFAERIADALECRAHLLFECDAAFVRRQWHAELAGNEDPGAGPRIDAQCLAEGRRDRTRQVFEKIHGVAPYGLVVQSYRVVTQFVAGGTTCCTSDARTVQDDAVAGAFLR